MTENVIFDFGQVLCRFDPGLIVSAICPEVTEQDREILCRVAFDRRFWDRLDRGEENAEVLPDICAALPESLRGYAGRILDGWIWALPEIPGMRVLISRLLSVGVHLYLLSDISRHFARHSGDIPILCGFSGMVFSGEWGYTKPSEEIFRILITKYGTDPGKSVFIDDRQENIDGAARAGISGFRFTGDAGGVYDFLREKIPALRADVSEK